MRSSWPAEKNLDLVEISPTATPPVCRIMDYGKFLYQQEKKERGGKKTPESDRVKEVKFRINVDDHDYETKKNHVLRFLDDGDKVKATIFFPRTRDDAHRLGTRNPGAADQRTLPTKALWSSGRGRKVIRCTRFWRPRKIPDRKQPAQSQPAPGRANQA